jgi:hypothetical protein
MKKLFRNILNLCKKKAISFITFGDVSLAGHSKGIFTSLQF